MTVKTFFLPFKAIKFIYKNKSIWHFTTIPIIINVATFLILGTLSLGYLFTKLGDWFSFSEEWYIAVILIILKVLVIIVGIIAILLCISMAANIFSAPFNELLSRKTEEIILGSKNKEKISLKLLAGDVKRTIKEETIKFILFTLAQIIIFLINLIPQPVGLFLYIIAACILNFYLFCFQYMDYSMARREIPFKKRWKIIFKHKLPSFSFGAAVGIGMFLPLINMFYIPVCVVAGTMLYMKYKPDC